MKLAIDIADSVVNELNTGCFTEEFIASRVVLPEFELSELTCLRVSVVPKSVEIMPVTRDSNCFDVAIDIGVQQKIGKDTDAEVTRLSDVVSEIVLFLNKHDIEIAKFKSITNEPVYIPEHLSEKAALYFDYNCYLQDSIMKKYINSLDVVVDDNTGAIVVVCGIDGMGKPDILSWPSGSDNWAAPATGAVSHKSSVIFIRVSIGGAYVSIDDADGNEKPYIIPPNYWREIVVPGGIPAGARIVAKNFTPGSNFTDMIVEVR